MCLTVSSTFAFWPPFDTPHIPGSSMHRKSTGFFLYHCTSLLHDTLVPEDLALCSFPHARAPCFTWLVKNQPSYVHCGLRGKQNHNDTKPVAVLQLCETHLNHANTHADLSLFWADLPVVSLCAEHLELLLHASHKLECFLNRHHVLTCVQSYVPYALQRHCAMQKGLAATARSPKLPNTCE